VDDDYGRSAADAASGCQPSASAAVASSQSGIPNAPLLTDKRLGELVVENVSAEAIGHAFDRLQPYHGSHNSWRYYTCQTHLLMLEE
jgi:hypothetical protein